MSERISAGENAVEERRTTARSAYSKSAKTLGFTVDGLNVEAARRQSTLGKGYTRAADTPARLKELQKQTITLPPHQSWTGDYTDWAADPFNDRNWRFQFHTLRWINPYLWDAQDGSKNSKAEWKRIVKSWADHNTPPERAPDDYAWMDMTDGNRAIQISIGAPLIDSDDDWYPELLVAHRNWLLDDTNIVPGNHGLHQNLGLFVVAAILDDEIGIQRAIERLSQQILDSFDEKGLNDEGSVGYHQMNLIWWNQAKHRLTLEGYSFPSAAVDRLDKAGRTLGYLLLPNGTMPQIGDGNRGKGGHRLHPMVDQVNKGKIKEKNLPTFHHYKNGFTIFRSGWGKRRSLKHESHTIVRHGRDLLRHSHDDRGSIHLYTSGRRWITDGGFHSYQQNDPDRDYTKSRLAHSLVDLPGQPHDKTGDVSVVFTEQHENVHSIEIRDDNFESASWCRRVVFLPRKNIWVIWDRITCETPELVQQQWLIDFGVEVAQVSDDTVELAYKHKRLHMRWFGDRPHFDVISGDVTSESRRGLIGVRWKKMKSGTSIHAKFDAKTVDSVVVISDPSEQDLSIPYTSGDSMALFDLRISEQGATHHLALHEHATELFQSS